MKKILLLIMFMILNVSLSFSQIAPYSLSPDWAFGNGGRLTFPNGNYPSSTAPIAGFRLTNTTYSVEASTSICHTDGTVAVYTNTMRIYNGSGTVNTDFVRNFVTDNTCSGSATGGAVAFPDPQSPNNGFYIVLVNDLTLGACPNRGVNQYRFTGTGTNVTYNSGATNIATNAFSSESITVGADGSGGYWLVIHDNSTSNIFRVWHYTSSGISSPVDYDKNDFFSSVNFHSYLKFSPCQNKIAFVGGNALTVYDFNRQTGVIGAELRRVAGIGHGVGLEFSPDGNRIFYSGQGSVVNYVDIATGVIGSVTGSSSWSMQMGPDGKIYTSGVEGSTVVGVISDPNTTPTYSTIPLPVSASIYRGLVNIAWLNPNLPTILYTNGATCRDYNFSYLFQTYFNGNITVVPNSEIWNFGDGTGDLTGLGSTPSHTFPSDGTYTVRVTVTDATCNQTWTNTTTVTVSCPMPVELINFIGVKYEDKVKLIWTTASEKNNDKFVIERSSDGINFTSIGVVKGNGTTTSTKNWTYYDYFPLSGTSYYRLVQYDYDGTKTYSNVISINYLSAIKFLVYPNPFNSEINIQYLGEGLNLNIGVYDVLGRKLKEFNTDSNLITFGNELNAGCYILKIFDGNEYHTIQIIKK